MMERSAEAWNAPMERAFSGSMDAEAPTREQVREHPWFRVFVEPSTAPSLRGADAGVHNIQNLDEGLDVPKFSKHRTMLTSRHEGDFDLNFDNELRLVRHDDVCLLTGAA